MSTLRKIAVTGAAGYLGKPILKAIVDSGKFDVTVLVRPGSKSTFPSSVTTKTVDFSSVDALKSALEGIDAVVSAVGPAGMSDQRHLIDAAITAGVKRFLPSEFGGDFSNPKAAKMPVFAEKIATDRYIEEKARQNPAFTYTLVRNFMFLDWGLEQSFLIEWKADKQRIFDGGDRLFSTTTLKSVGQAVVGVLTHPEETKNRAVYVDDLKTTQNRVLAVAKELAPHRQWNTVDVSVEELTSNLDKKFASGELGEYEIYEYFVPSVFGKDYGGIVEKYDNELLGVKGDMTDEDIKAMLKPLLAN